MSWEVLFDDFEWEQTDYQEALAGINRGIEDMNAGRTQPMEDFFEDLRLEHDFPN